MKKKIIGAVLAALMLGGAVTVYAKDITEPNADGIYVINVGNGDTLPLTIHLVGDITGDQKANAKDYALIKKHIQEKKLLSGYEFKCADINDDGKVNAKDYALLKKHIQEKQLLW